MTHENDGLDMMGTAQKMMMMVMMMMSNIPGDH
jgi:hypothetical protein